MTEYNSRICTHKNKIFILEKKYELQINELNYFLMRINVDIYKNQQTVVDKN